MSSADIVMNSNFMSGSGTASQGLRFHTTNDNVYIGNNTFYSTGKLNVDGNIHLGRSDGSVTTEIKANTTTSGTGKTFTIQGAGASGGGHKAGNVFIKGGAGEDNNSDGGDLYIDGGAAVGTGTAGKVILRSGTTSVLELDANSDVNVKAGSLIVDTATEGIVHKGSTTVAQATGWTTGVTTNGTSGVITLESTTTLEHTVKQSFKLQTQLPKPTH